jgi:E3 ubiquitin-protein ligase RNF115/126
MSAYVFGADEDLATEGFDNVLEQLMQAAGPQGPIPATEVVIEGLPRLTFTEESLGQRALKLQPVNLTLLAKSPYKDCPVCKDDFNVGDEVMRVPCT